MTDRLVFSPRCSRILEALREHLIEGSQLDSAINENREAQGFARKGL